MTRPLLTALALAAAALALHVYMTREAPDPLARYRENMGC
jgi:hypothetical protein